MAMEWLTSRPSARGLGSTRASRVSLGASPRQIAFCGWELAPVWHEKETWKRFPKSARDETAAQVWLRDPYAGAA